MTRKVSMIGALLLSLALILGVAACGGSDESSGGETTTAETTATTEETTSSSGGKDPSELKIADFEAGSNNSYVQARIKAVEDKVNEIGAEVEIFDANWDPTNQVNQMETALANGKYDAWIVQAVEPDPLCDVVQKAVDQGVMVMVANQPLCDNETYMEGTVGFAGGQTLDTYQLWLEWILEDRPEGKALLITGPAEDANRRNLLKAYDELKADYPNFEIVADQPSDYSTASAFQGAQDVLLAQDQIDTVISNWSGSTQGVVEAIESMNLDREIMVYDLGANVWAVDAVKDGRVRMTLPLLPALEGQRSVEALAEFAETGEPVGFINLVEDPSLGGLPILTRDNIDTYEAQFD